MSKFWLIVIVIAAVIPLLGCCEEVKKQLAECKAELEECQDGKFTLYIGMDSLATFVPFNNQYREDEGYPVLPYRDGMLLQIGDFIDAEHGYSHISLHFADGSPTKDYLRSTKTPVWIDVDCATTPGQPITVDMARILTPVVNDTATHNRRIHGGLIPGQKIIPLTLWAPESGIRLMTGSETFGANATSGGGQQHGHVDFTFTSANECEVRVLMEWPAVGAQPDPEIYPGNGGSRVSRIEVSEDAPRSPQHGGPHQPGWFGTGP
jgi:hypothetical protein